MVTDKGTFTFNLFLLFSGMAMPQFIESMTLRVNGVPYGTVRFKP